MLTQTQSGGLKKSMTQGRKTWARFQSYHVLAVILRASHLISLSLDFLICKMEIILPILSVVYQTKLKDLLPIATCFFHSALKRL